VIKRLESATPQIHTLAILPGYMFNASGVTTYLEGKHADVILTSSNTVPVGSLKHICAVTQQEKAEVATRLDGYDEVILVTPSITLLRELSQGNDASFEAMLMLHFLLWHRKATVLLDFEPVSYLRNTLFAGLADVLDALEKAGFCIEIVAPENKSGGEEKELVTERDVKDACRDGRMRLNVKKDTIVTQLARDTAKELGVSIGF
jgi:hypothetical protein